jgi:hypothetical protein
MNIDGHRGDEESKGIDIGPTKQIFKKLAKKQNYLQSESFAFITIALLYFLHIKFNTN